MKTIVKEILLVRENTLPRECAYISMGQQDFYCLLIVIRKLLKSSNHSEGRMLIYIISFLTSCYESVDSEYDVILTNTFL